MTDQISTDDLPGIGTYWYGSKLSVLERACLCSMMAQGHQVTLFTHDKVKGIPEGIKVCDARAITGDRPVIVDAKHTSPAKFADQFRYHMIGKTGLIWLDTDAFLLKPIRTDDGYLFAYGDKECAVIFTGVLSLPKHSPTLKNMIEFCDDYYPIPPYLNWYRRNLLKFRKTIGFPVHVSKQPWGVWGPKALTWFLNRNKESRYALKSNTLYPIRDINHYFLPGDEVREFYVKDAVSVHLYGRGIRNKLRKTGLEGIPRNSFLWEVMQSGE